MARHISRTKTRSRTLRPALRARPMRPDRAKAWLVHLRDRIGQFRSRRPRNCLPLWMGEEQPGLLLQQNPHARPLLRLDRRQQSPRPSAHQSRSQGCSRSNRLMPPPRAPHFVGAALGVRGGRAAQFTKSVRSSASGPTPATASAAFQRTSTPSARSTGSTLTASTSETANVALRRRCTSRRPWGS